jgi:hypothetical protein
MTLAPWQTSSGTSFAGTVTQSTDIPAPDGSANVNKVVVQNLTSLVARNTHNAAAGQRTGSVWAYLPSGQPGVTGLRFACDWSDAESGSISQTIVTNEWVRLTSTATLAAARSWQDFNINLPSGASLPVGTVLYLAFAQDENGPGGSYIPVTTANVTVTDYTLDDDGIATFADGVTPATPLTYFRTGRVRVTLPVSSDNGLGLLEIAKAFRSVLAARLMIELQLSTIFENVGSSGGLTFSNGATACMPFMAIGTLT